MSFEQPETAQARSVDQLLRWSWVKTSAPSAMRTDDIWFIDDKTGWAVNGNGQILKTTDGGETWIVQAQFENIWLRCVGFVDAQTGWVGTVGGRGDDGAPSLANRLLNTTDGGASWNWVDLPDPVPGRVCGMCIADAQTIYLSGTNNPAETPGVMKSVDRGRTWTSIPLGDKASLLVDIFFRSPDEGWVVGGTDALRIAGRPADREDVIPVVLHTKDGGLNWDNLAGDPALVRQFPRGEWGWKIQYLPPCTLLVALENERDGAILRSDDTGASWARLKINDKQRNSNLEGIGFLTPEVGWVGGWGDMDGKTGSTSMTSDGGANWRNANEVGRNLNRFRFLGDPVHTVFASGDTIYRLAHGQTGLVATDSPSTSPPAADPFPISVEAPAGTSSITVTIWDRFGSLIRTLRDDGAKTNAETVPFLWDIKDAAGNRVRPGPYMIRVTVDRASYGMLAHVSAAGAAIAVQPTESQSSLPHAKESAANTVDPGFAANIRPLFRDFDRASMLKDFDLFDYDAVKSKAPAILSRVKDGSMPCDVQWTADETALFERWIDAGSQP